MIGNYLVNSIYQKNYEDYSPSNEFLDILDRNLKRNWNIYRDRIFYDCIYEDNKKKEGWKIHISSTIEASETILTIVAQVLDGEKVNFKVLCDKNIVQLSSQKFYPRNESGKFITIYPSSNGQFRKVLNLLYKKLQDFKGPYVLTDQRFKDSRCIYYRYGSFISNEQIDKYGNRKMILHLTDGSVVEDKRDFDFKPPLGIKDIVLNETKDEQSKLLKQYDILKCIHMSNSGGVYLGKNNDELVVIKEARFGTVLSIEDRNINSINLLKNEYKQLRKLENSKYFPKPIDCFFDIENQYLIEEYIEGVTLYDYCAKNNPIYKARANVKEIINYYKQIYMYFTEIVKILICLEENGLIMTDLDGTNIMVDNHGRIKFIDLESCSRGQYKMVKCKPVKGLLTNNNSLLHILFMMMISHETMLHYDQQLINRTVSFIEYYFHVNLDLNNSIHLIQSNATLDQILYSIENAKIEIDNHMKYEIRFDPNLIESTYRRKINEFGFKVPVKNEFDENGFCYGRIGIRLLNQEIQDVKYSTISLIDGELGYVWVMIQEDKLSIAKRKIVDLYHNISFVNNYSLGYGLAGYLYCMLFYVSKEKDELIIEYINEVSNFLICKLEENKYFYGNEIEIPYGFTKGASGISLALLYTYCLTRDTKVLAGANELISLEIKHCENDEEKRALYLPYSSTDRRKSPYFSEGTAGLISVIIRFKYINSFIVKDDIFQKLVNTLFTPLCINAGQFQGICGLGETLIDLYSLTKNKEYLNQALRIRNALSCYCVQEENSTLIPGDGFKNVTFDYASGMTGIIEYLDRCSNPNKIRKLFLDQYFMETTYENTNK